LQQKSKKQIRGFTAKVILMENNSYKHNDELGVVGK
jgi:hypothetical protein